MIKKNNSNLKSPLPFVQGVIVTWNKKKYVLRLLECLKNLNYPPDRISFLVVDNASEDNTVSEIKSRFPNVQLLCISENLGGAGGFNAGMRWAQNNRPEADYFWLLDNDVLVSPSSLIELVQVMEYHRNAAICGSKIMDIDNPNTLIEIGAFFDFKRGEIKRNEPEEDNKNAVFNVDYVAACSLLARASHVREAGLWREDFFIYWDDMEWGARFKALGREVLAASASIVYHPSWSGRTADNSSIWRTYYRVRNGFSFFFQYTSGWNRVALMFRMGLRYMIISTRTGLRAKNHLSHAFLAAIDDFIHDRYGPKNLDFPTDDIFDFIRENNISSVCLFSSSSANFFFFDFMVSEFLSSFPEVRLNAIVPSYPKSFLFKENKIKKIFIFKKKEGGPIPLLQKLRLTKILMGCGPTVLLSSEKLPLCLSLPARGVAELDPITGKVLNVEKSNPKFVLRLFLKFVSKIVLLLKRFFF